MSEIAISQIERFADFRLNSHSLILRPCFQVAVYRLQKEYPSLYYLFEPFLKIIVAVAVMNVIMQAALRTMEDL